MERISILIPVFNESSYLEEILRKVEAVDFDMEKEIIIIDDCSTDGTKEIYSKIPYKVIYHEENLGKGAAIRSGLKDATGEIIIIQDADLEYNPEDYKSLVQIVKNGEADVVYGSRLANKKDSSNFLFLNYVANQFLSFLTRLLFNKNITDMETCYKVFKADIIKNIEIKSNRFDFEPEITAKVLKQSVRYRELPISYNARNNIAGKKIGWRDGIQAIYALIKYRYFK